MYKYIFLRKWTIEGNKVRLLYHDGTVAYIDKNVFLQSRGRIISGEKSVIMNEFNITSMAA